MTSSDHSSRDWGREALAAHVEGCDECRGGGLPVEQIASALRASAINIDATGFSLRAVERLRPELLRRARALYRRQVVVAVLLALLPLPAVLAYDTYLLQVVHGFISAILPAAFATYLIVSYAAFLLLLFATTYAAIPVILSRSAAAPSAHS